MAQWRTSESQDDEAIVAMSLDLYWRKPPPDGIAESQVRATLAAERLGFHEKRNADDAASLVTRSACVRARRG